MVSLVSCRDRADPCEGSCDDTLGRKAHSASGVSVGGSSSAGLIFFNASTTAVGLTKRNPSRGGSSGGVASQSVNPARSTGVAFFNGNGAPAQLWVFWLAPLIGAAFAGIAYPYLFGRHEALADRPVRDDALETDDDSGQHRAGRP